MQTTIPWGKIKALEDEIKALKSLGQKASAKKIVSKAKKNPLKGFLKGINISDEEIEKALEDSKTKFDLDHILYQRHKK